MHLKNQLPLWAFCILLVCSLQSHAMVESAKTKSFREWKSEQVHDALSRVTATKTKIQLAKSKDPNLARRKSGLEATSGANSENLETQLQQDQSILEMAKDLSVTDYFVGYLVKIQNKKAAYNEVAGKLTSEEVAELMTAYANSVFGSHTPELAPSATDLSSDRVK
jgi:hypothetical protein